MNTGVCAPPPTFIGSLRLLSYQHAKKQLVYVKVSVTGNNFSRTCVTDFKFQFPYRNLATFCNRFHNVGFAHITNEIGRSSISVLLVLFWVLLVLCAIVIHFIGEQQRNPYSFPQQGASSKATLHSFMFVWYGVERNSQIANLSSSSVLFHYQPSPSQCCNVYSSHSKREKRRLISIGVQWCCHFLMMYEGTFISKGEHYYIPRHLSPCHLLQQGLNTF